MSFVRAVEQAGISPSVFEAGGRSYDVESVLKAADFRGELFSFWRQWSQQTRNADVASEAGAEVDEAVLENLMNEYRYTRDLVTAEECEAWLATRGVAPEDFTEHFARCSLAESRTPEEFPREEDDRTNSEELGRLFRIDWVLSDDFDRAARQLAWRVALDCEAPASQASKNGTEPIGRASDTTNRAARNRIMRIDPQELGELQRLESAFQAQLRALLTAARQESCLASLRLPLTMVSLALVEVDNLGAAHEAFLCVKEDGMSLAKVAAESGYTLGKMDVLLEELPEPWQWPVFSAPVGAVLPPFSSAEGAQLCVVEGRRGPSLDDPRARQRVDAMILRQHFGSLESRHVRWRMTILDSA